MHERTDVADELLKRIARDDAVRARLAATGALFRRAPHPELARIHSDNAEWLGGIVARVGWPGPSMVGTEAADAAWRIVQHAIHHPAFMRAMLPVLQEAAERREADPAHVAMLDDRIRVFEGRMQRFGTQFDWDRSLTRMVPMVGVEDPEGLDDRRAAIGLPPMCWSREPPSDEPPPSDWEERQRRMVEWAKQVGWRS